MASTGKQSPLGANATASYIQNIGLNINPNVSDFIGASKTNNNYTFGKLVNDTCLLKLTEAIQEAFNGSISSGSQVADFDGTISGNTLTVTNVHSGEIRIGSVISGTGITDGTIVNKQLLGNIGGTGTYEVNITQTASASNISADGCYAEWHDVTDGSWGSFMNSYAIWSGNDTDNTTQSYFTSVKFPTNGMYTFVMAASNYMNVILDFNTPISIGVDMYTDTTTVSFNVKAGIHVITMIITNSVPNSTSGGALRILDESNTEIWNSRNDTPISAVEGSGISNENYNKLLAIGKGIIPALGNCPPDTWTNNDPTKTWFGQATTSYYLMQDPSYAQGQAQTATWLPFNCSNTNKSITQWGFLRLFALQAWNEFNYNGEPIGTDMPQYKDFMSSFLSVDGYIKQNNISTNVLQNAPTFMQGTYSNMNDLISADITGISLATNTFGQDCITAGRTIDLSKIQSFGLPSVLLQTIRKNKILTQSLSFALIAAGLSITDIENIANGLMNPVPKEKEQQIYGAFLIILGKDLADILFALNCKTRGLETLADLLSVKKLFPNSYKSLTVPLYNATPGPTNSKTYYPIFDGNSVSSRIKAPQVKTQVGEVIPLGNPPTKVNTNSTVQSTSNIVATTNQVIQTRTLDNQLTRKGNAYSNVSIPTLPMELVSSNQAEVVAGNPTSEQAVLNATKETSRIQEPALGFGSYLVDILPEDIAISAGAFSYSVQQVKNISSIDFEKFSQVVSSIETTKDLNLINGTSVPVDTQLAQQGQSLTQLGSGPNNTYTISDFFGCMSGLPYPWKTIYNLITELQTSTLAAIYQNLYSEITGACNNTTIAQLIDDANTEITFIKNSQANKASSLNYLYNLVGDQLTIEQRARYMVIQAVPQDIRDVSLNAYPLSMVLFVDAIADFAKNTLPHMTAQTLEAISDLTTVGGQSAVGLMRESRNAAKLELLGVSQDNNISGSLSAEQELQLLLNGTVLNSKPAMSTNGILAPLPTQSFDGKNILNSTKVIEGNPAILLNPPEYPIVGTFVPTGPTTVLDLGKAPPGSMAPSKAVNLLPPNLKYTSGTTLPNTYTVSEAIDQVIKCNCDCWI